MQIELHVPYCLYIGIPFVRICAHIYYECQVTRKV